MSRWQPDARARLERAALELFAEQGFAATTVPEITARAGLTTRTFFRHFADKREVIFAHDEIPELAARLLAEAPPSVEPSALILAGLRTVAEERFEPRRDDFRQRRDIVRTDGSLGERDLRKWAAVSEAIRSGFIARGVAQLQAALLAETTVSLLRVSLDRWLDARPEVSLYAVIRDTLAALQSTVLTLTETPVPTPPIRSTNPGPSGRAIGSATNPR